MLCSIIQGAKTWELPKRLLTEGWIKKIRYIYTMGYYSATRKDEILPLATSWMNLEDIVLSKIGQ